MANRQIGIGAVLRENVLCDRCAIAAGNVILCPLHVAAEEMREALADLLDLGRAGFVRGEDRPICKACGYNERVGYVTLCPLHAAAEEMRALLAALLSRADARLIDRDTRALRAALERARALLAKVGG